MGELHDYWQNSRLIEVNTKKSGSFMNTSDFCTSFTKHEIR
jgi:hypothetical protein